MQGDSENCFIALGPGVAWVLDMFCHLYLVKDTVKDHKIAHN
jgi:hypothetical protein